MDTPFIEKVIDFIKRVLCGNSRRITLFSVFGLVVGVVITLPQATDGISMINNIKTASNIAYNPHAIAISSFFNNSFGVLRIALIFGGTALAVCIVQELFKNNYVNAEQMEKDTNAQLLGVIPWLDKEAYEAPDIMFAIGESASSYSLAYQKAVSNIRLLGNIYEKKVLAFTSSELSKQRSTVIMNVALGICRTAQSVIVVDADFRTPSVAKEADFEVNNGFSLDNLLEEITGCIKTGRPFDQNRVGLYIRSVRNVDNFFVLPNISSIPDPSEYLYSDAFTLLVRILRKKYNWVFIDTPPVLAVPDAVAVSPHIDGMVVITGANPNKALLRKIFRQFESYKINVVGIISRELHANRAFSSNEYIRQMFARLMPLNDNMINE